MAGISGEQLKDLMECSICSSTFTDPRSLPCLHTYCMGCLQQIGVAKNKRPGSRIPCPVCRKEFTIPVMGLMGLPKNFFIENLMQISTASSPTTSKQNFVCDTCEEKSNNPTTSGASFEIPSAEKYCAVCRQRLCRDCAISHQKNKITMSHKIISLESHVNTIELLEKIASILCDIHKKKEKIYCSDCDVVVCSLCFVESHKRHKGSDARKNMEQFLQQIENGRDTLSGSLTDDPHKKIDAEKRKSEIIEDFRKIGKSVIEGGEKLKKRVDTEVRSLLTNLDSYKDEALKSLKAEEEAVDEHTKDVERYLVDSVVRADSNSLSTTELYRYLASLTTRANELTEMDDTLIKHQIVSIRLDFREVERTPMPSIGVFDGGLNIIRGKQKRQQDLSTKEETHQLDKSQKGDAVPKNIVREKKKRQPELNTDDEIRQPNKRQKGHAELSVYLEDPVLVKTIDTKPFIELINGIAILSNELFVIRERSSEVDVYDLMSLHFSRIFKLESLLDPKDLASSEAHSCLYILDGKAENESMSEILRVDQMGGILNRWPISKFSYVTTSLCVTNESNVIIMKMRELIEYSPGGKKRKTITISDSLGQAVNLQHAVQQTVDHILVCHGGTEHKVCKVDCSNGMILKSFGGEPGSGEGSLKRPVHMVVDPDGSVLVADQLNCRVLLLNSDLEYQREILSKYKQRLDNPRKICLDQSNGRLFVLEMRGILVFKIK